MRKKTPVPREFVTIYHPEAGTSRVHPRSVKHWEEMGWSSEPPKAAEEPTADVAEADAVEKPAEAAPALEVTEQLALPAKTGRRGGRNSSTPSASSTDVSAEVSTAPDTLTE